MNIEKFLVMLSGTLCFSSILVTSLIFSHLIDSSMPLGIPIHIGIVVSFSILIFSKKSKDNWKGSVPIYLQILLPIVTITGLGILINGFSNVMPAISPSGEPARHLNAYFENGECLAVFNKNSPVKVPVEFCMNFRFHFALIFCGGWLLFSAPIYWVSMRRRKLPKLGN